MWWVTCRLPMRQPKCTSSRCHQIFESAGKLSLPVHCKIHDVGKLSLILPCVHLLFGPVDGIHTKHQVGEWVNDVWPVFIWVRGVTCGG